MSEGSADYALPITEQGVIRIVPRIRERYLTQAVDEAFVQAVGHHLQITIWSDRSNIRIKVPFDGFRAERVYTRSINSWGINVNKWTEVGKHADGSGVGWHNDARLEVHYGSESGKEMVSATVETFEGEKPDV